MPANFSIPAAVHASSYYGFESNLVDSVTLADASVNAVVVITADGTYNTLGLVRGSKTRWACVSVEDDINTNVTISDLSLDVRNGVSHGIFSKQSSGTIAISNVTATNNRAADGGSVITIDAGALGTLTSATLDNVTSENSLIRFAQVSQVRATDIEVTLAPDISLDLAENLDDVLIDGFALGGFISHSPNAVEGTVAIGKLQFKSGSVTGRHDHLQAEEAAWQDITWNITFTPESSMTVNTVAIDDETSIASGVTRRLVRVDFLGAPSDRIYRPDAGAENAIGAQDCTFNGLPWRP